MIIFKRAGNRLIAAIVVFNQRNKKIAMKALNPI